MDFDQFGRKINAVGRIFHFQNSSNLDGHYTFKLS
jgi:hypothetical protein